VAREVAQGEWSRLRHALARLEYAGEILRGYFVDGLSGEQYALEDAADDLLRGGRRAEPHVVVNALDPANLWGKVFALTRRDGVRATLPRGAAACLVFRAGRPVLAVEAHGRELTPLAGWENADFPGAIRALQLLAERPLPFRPWRRLEVTTWDGAPAVESEARDAFVASGFAAADGRLLWEPTPRALGRR
jgi:ATP-dependent Lhr-like helicase